VSTPSDFTRWLWLTALLFACSALGGDQAAIEQCKKDLKDFQKECLDHCKIKKRANCEASCNGAAKLMEKECQNATNDEEPKN
jgi:hypothetical protein